MSISILNPRKSPGRHGEAGSTFVTILLFSMMLAVIVGAAMSRSLFTWHGIGTSYNHDRAMHTAESGIDMTLFAVNHGSLDEIDYYSTTGFDAVLRSLAGHGEISGLTGSLENPSGEKVGDFESTVVIDPTNDNRLILTATGTVPAGETYVNKVSRKIRVVVYRDTISPDVYRKVLWTPGGGEFNGITEIHGPVVSGSTLESSANLDPHERVEPYEYTQYDPETDETFQDYGSIDEGRNTDGDLDNNVELPYEDFILEALKELAKDQNHYFETCPKNPLDLPQTYWYDYEARMPNVVFVTSEMRFDGQVNLGGLIIVLGGDVIFGGNANIDGIIYTDGEFDTHGGGNQEININGGIFCSYAELEGHAVIEYNWEYMEALKNIVLARNRYRFFSWQELLPETENDGTVIAQPSEPISDPSTY